MKAPSRQYASGRGGGFLWVPNIVPPHATWAYSMQEAAELVSTGDLDVGVDWIGQRPQPARKRATASLLLG
ncbi:hypothetical protein GCM10010176_093350 [Nonomuraea spiralis]|nr:hypothetical protein GCM10010176_093350 [Nonomuraea spiralis]